MSVRGRGQAPFSKSNYSVPMNSCLKDTIFRIGRVVPIREAVSRKSAADPERATMVFGGNAMGSKKKNAVMSYTKWGYIFLIPFLDGWTDRAGSGRSGDTRSEKRFKSINGIVGIRYGIRIFESSFFGRIIDFLQIIDLFAQFMIVHIQSSGFAFQAS